jgi:site-specific DNA-cytosine methylase
MRVKDLIFEKDLYLRAKEESLGFYKKRNYMSYKVLGISAGNGVMLHPFRNDLIGNMEIRREYLLSKNHEQWDLNFKGTPFWTSPHKSWLKFAPDVIIGHPKCGNSSMFALSRGKAFTTRSDEPSLAIFMNAVLVHEPKIFAFENLPKLLETYSEEDISEALGGKYHLISLNSSVAAWGNSQISRKRLVIIGFKKSFFPSSPITSNALLMQQFQSLSDAHPIDVYKKLPLTKALLKNVPDQGDITEPLSDIITLYAGFKISLKDLRDFWLSNPHLRHYPIKNSTMNTAPGVYINRDNDYPLTVRKTNRQFGPEGIQMSPREMARIQGIPDDFLILDSGYDEKTLINKGRFTVANTPPYEIGKTLKMVCDILL